MNAPTRKPSGPVGALCGQRRLRWIMAIVTFLALAYPLGTGPVDYFFYVGNQPRPGDGPLASHAFWFTFYRPFYAALKLMPAPIQAAHESYNDFWWQLGKRRMTKPAPAPAANAGRPAAVD